MSGDKNAIWGCAGALGILMIGVMIWAWWMLQ